jgi:hypothetical protein
MRAPVFDVIIAIATLSGLAEGVAGYLELLPGKYSPGSLLTASISFLLTDDTIWG